MSASTPASSTLGSVPATRLRATFASSPSPTALLLERPPHPRPLPSRLPPPPPPPPLPPRPRPPPPPPPPSPPTTLPSSPRAALLFAPLPVPEHPSSSSSLRIASLTTLARLLASTEWTKGGGSISSPPACFLAARPCRRGGCLPPSCMSDAVGGRTGGGLASAARAVRLSVASAPTTLEGLCGAGSIELSSSASSCSGRARSLCARFEEPAAPALVRFSAKPLYHAGASE
mmetsp:Transcript_29708/g.62499  ORF Transcript_29708/g.62499 Transcript_29708/m.62499 type:complete len:231 (-) Transcript_29708:493-1185(-)